MQIKAKLIQLIRRAAEEEQVFGATLSDEERAAPGTPERWSAKDLMAHLASWKEWEAHNLELAARGETPHDAGDLDLVNADILERNQHRPWSEVLAVWQRAQDSLVERLNALSEADLTSTEYFPWQAGRPLWRLIAGNSYTHPITHLAQYYAEHGRVAYANQIQGEAADLLAQLDDSPAWQGILSYNLACHYALVGEKEKAIAGLRRALGLNPELIEWSKQDSDLASLRQEAAYQALYASLAMGGTPDPG
jgi:tetratricopeptide (TPR) repeat protein